MCPYLSNVQFADHQPQRTDSAELSLQTQRHEDLTAWCAGRTGAGGSPHREQRPRAAVTVMLWVWTRFITCFSKSGLKTSREAAPSEFQTPPQTCRSGVCGDGSWAYKSLRIFQLSVTDAPSPVPKRGKDPELAECLLFHCRGGGRVLATLRHRGASGETEARRSAVAAASAPPRAALPAPSGGAHPSQPLTPTQPSPMSGGGGRKARPGRPRAPAARGFLRRAQRQPGGTGAPRKLPRALFPPRP